jgi:hypothetical protein
VWVLGCQRDMRCCRWRLMLHLCIDASKALQQCDSGCTPAHTVLGLPLTFGLLVLLV